MNETEIYEKAIITVDVICPHCDKVWERRTGVRDVLFPYPKSFGDEIEDLCADCEAKQFNINMVERLRIPPRYEDMTFESFDDRTPEIGQIKRRVETLAGDRWIILMGRRGLGKTHLAVSALKELYQMGVKPGQYLSAVRFIPDYVRAGFNRDEIWERFIEHKQVLLLDDLGQGESGKAEGAQDERVSELVGALIDHIYRNERQLIVTTNIESVEGLIGRYGAWAIDRICECGEFIIFPTGLSSARLTIDKGILIKGEE